MSSIRDEIEQKGGVIKDIQIEVVSFTCVIIIYGIYITILG